MVWTNGDSPLYKCVEKFNSAPHEECNSPAGDFCVKDEHGKSAEPPQTECCAPPPKPFPEQECHSTGAKPCCDREQEFRRKAPCGAPPPAPSPGNLLQKITGDRDFMLIAALILLLLHEKADMKLIAALAFIILT